MIETIAHKRNRFRAGSLTIQKRAKGPSVYEYRWREADPSGGTRQRKQVLGTTRELTKTQAQKLAEPLRQLANASQVAGTVPLTVERNGNGVPPHLPKQGRTKP
jgi:integrase